MARYVFGGKIEDFAFMAVGTAVGLIPSGTTVTFWTAQTGGVQITDLQDMSNSPIGSVGTLANGFLPQFQGPSTTGSFSANAGSMWAAIGASARVQIFGALDPSTLSATYAPAMSQDQTIHTAAFTAVAMTIHTFDSTGGSVPITLPSAPGDKTVIVLKDIATIPSGSTVTCGGSDVFDKPSGSTTSTLKIAGQAKTLQYDHTRSIWVVTGDDLPLGSLDKRYVLTQLPQVSGRANGLLYNGNDETATVNTILSSMQTFGAGVLMLEGLARCDSQILIPSTVSGTQVQQAPLRITSQAQQYAPGSTYTGADPYPACGLDLRYAGRTDASCTTTLASEIVANTAAVSGDQGQQVIGAGIPDNTWILASNPGVGWTLSKAARATGTVSLTSFGGRIQSLGYGSLEIDHLTILTGASTSAPFGLSTATRVQVHDNTFVGTSGKSGNTCDEDPWVFGGTGQGTNLTSALTSGNSYTSLAVQALPVGLVSGRTVVIGAGTQTQTVTLSAPANAGDTSISVTSFTANANYAVRQAVAFRSTINQATATSWSQPIAYHQGFKSRIYSNQFYRCRRIGIGGFVTDLSITDNGWMHDCGSNVAFAPSTLTSALVAGTNYTSLAVTALSTAVVTGDIIQVGVGDSAMEFTASAGAAVGATSVSVNSQSATYAAAIGTKAFNSTAGIGAAIYSYGDFVEANTVHIGYNRMGVSGGYNYATRFDGATVNSVIIGNDLQDLQADPNFIAMHRFGRGAANNTVIPGLQGSGNVLVDDFSQSSGVLTQIIVDPVRPSRFPLGINVGTSFTYGIHSGGSFTAFDLDGDTLYTLSGSTRQWNWKGAVFIDGNSGGNGTTFLTIGNNSTASDAQITLNPPTGQAATVQFKYAGTNRWQIYNGAGATNLYVRDMTNSLMALTFTAGSGTTGSAAFAGLVTAGAGIQAATFLQASGSSGSRQWSGSGAPTTPGGSISYNAGDRYWRTDTPSTANQRLYIVTTAGTSPVWTGIL